MSNIILTTECPRKCSYCFAKDNNENHMQFNMENFKKVIRWLIEETRVVSRIGLLGGEPTTHPDFLEFLDYMLSKKLSTVVFTNGMLEDTNMFKGIIDIAKKNHVRNSEDLGFCLNVNEAKHRSRKEERLQHAFLSQLGRVTSFSFNIFEGGFDPLFLIDMVRKYKTLPNIRLGLAAPLGNRNEYLKTEFYPEVADKIIALGTEAKKAKVTIGFDCGWCRCIFSKEQHEELRSLKVSPWTYDCGPVLDIYPNLEVANCYPMSRIMRVKMEDYESYYDLYKFWEAEIRKYKPIFDECYECEYYKGMRCAGGCKAHRANG